ncbi:hypothetical protein [Mesorhizobium sp. B4-1-4]|uniref:hypothetical protein n=1 Tax=Mesorhizobium sp. B4-1-4 TaxID=2589888 RepID=UPI00112EBAC9|nr:hypothetical protein [Mesorhizobium sp. B4-1-4]UCI33264.1 hypothetical protein FJW03_07500 [Mesorhizobium sp. B4-1-4]
MDMLDKALADLDQAAEMCQASCEMMIHQQAAIFSDPELLKAAITQLYRQHLAISRNISFLGSVMQALRDGIKIPPVPN